MFEVIISKVLLKLSSFPFLNLYSKLNIYVLFILIKFIHDSKASFITSIFMLEKLSFLFFFFNLISPWNILYFQLFFFLISTNFSISTKKLSLSLNNFFACSLFYLSLNPADHKVLPILLLQISQFCIYLFQTATLGLCHISLLQFLPNYFSNLLIYDIATLIKSTHIHKYMCLFQVHGTLQATFSFSLLNF